MVLRNAAVAQHDFMTADATDAVSCDVLRSGNSAIRHTPDAPVPFAWGEPTSPCTAEQTVFLSNTDCAAAATHFQGGIDSWDHLNDAADPQDHYAQFLSWSSFDTFLSDVAKRLAMAAANQWYGKKYYGVNTKDSRSSGMHWVCVVIEILPNGGLPANHLLAPVAVPIRNQVAQRIFDDSDDDSNSESAPSPSSALQYYSSADNGLSASLVLLALFSTILSSAVQLVADATLSAFISASYIFVRHVALMKLFTSAALAASRLCEFSEVLFGIFQMASLALAYYA